jgi:hypothetical protein
MAKMLCLTSLAIILGFSATAENDYFIIPTSRGFDEDKRGAHGSVLASN